MTSDQNAEGLKFRFLLTICPRCLRPAKREEEWPVGLQIDEMCCSGCQNESDEVASHRRDRALGLMAIWN